MLTEIEYGFFGSIFLVSFLVLVFGLQFLCPS
jgi:hypothetical protein